MLEKILDKVLSEQGVLVAALFFAVWTLWRKLETLIDRNIAAASREENERRETKD